MPRLLLVLGFLLLLFTEILRVYFIMPFPGSQQANTIDLAYFIENQKWLFRIIGVCMVLFAAYQLFGGWKTIFKVLFFLVVIFYGLIFFFFNFKFEADKMFYQPGYKTYSGKTGNKIDSSKLVIGIDINGQSRAYPIQLIGYHHQVRDTVGGTVVMITYCTVCRTGRVYSPLVNGKPEIFRLVGMDHFNAMFEDQTTKSWWQQATGMAIAGPLKGTRLEEFPSRQSSLSSWFMLHPNSTVFQGDTNYKEDYEDLSKFDKGNGTGHLTKRDSASWKMKSWVIGIKSDGLTKAYDWNDLLKKNFIQDTIGNQSVLLVLEKDTSSFHAYNSIHQGRALFFIPDIEQGSITDSLTHSVWNLNGLCISGPLLGTQLDPLPVYQEFWHSWKQFHPNTTIYQHVAN
jgi:hypothetical protein